MASRAPRSMSRSSKSKKSKGKKRIVKTRRSRNRMMGRSYRAALNLNSVFRDDYISERFQMMERVIKHKERLIEMLPTMGTLMAWAAQNPNPSINRAAKWTLKMMLINGGDVNITDLLNTFIREQNERHADAQMALYTSNINLSDDADTSRIFYEYYTNDASDIDELKKLLGETEFLRREEIFKEGSNEFKQIILSLFAIKREMTALDNEPRINEPDSVLHIPNH